MSEFKTIVRDIGGIFTIIGLASLVVILVPLYFGEFLGNSSIDGISPILITAITFLLFGLPFYFLFKKADPANFKTAMITAALGWLFVSLIGSIPLLLIPYDKTTLAHMDSLSAFFESMSGWTGTGLSLISKQELIPYTFQFWRTFIQWVGGVGVIILTLAILARPGVGSFVLYKGEGHSEKTHPSIISTIRTIWWIFLLFTVIGVSTLVIIGLLTPNGMDPWQSLNHAMVGIATGGFSVNDDSIASFNTISQLVIVILMIAGAIAFAAHYDLLRGRIKKFFSDAQLRALIILIILGVIALTILNLNTNSNGGNILSSLKNSGFQFTSAITCTGFSTVNLANWGDSAKLILAFAMVIGGAAGSTSGGIKLFRGILLYKGVGWRIKRAISTPHRVFVHKLGNKPLSNEDAMDLINEAAIISFMWIIALIAGVLLMLQFTTSESLTNVFFEVCSAQGNVGLSTGITNMGMESGAKATLIMNMWIGRLEIIPVIVLIRSMFTFRKNI